MAIRVRPESPVPIYEQIVSQVVFNVAAGDLAPGDRVPSVRELAADLLVNPNTVARAFQELERGGVLVSRRGLGMEITPDAPKLCRDRRKQIVLSRMREALRDAVAAGLTAADVTRMVETEWPKLHAGHNGTAK